MTTDPISTPVPPDVVRRIHVALVLAAEDDIGVEEEADGGRTICCACGAVYDDDSSPHPSSDSCRITKARTALEAFDQVLLTTGWWAAGLP